MINRTRFSEPKRVVGTLFQKFEALDPCKNTLQKDGLSQCNVRVANPVYYHRVCSEGEDWDTHTHTKICSCLPYKKGDNSKVTTILLNPVMGSTLMDYINQNSSE